MDYMYGSVRVRYAVDVAGVSVTPPFVKRLPVTVIEAAERYNAAIMNVAFGELTPAEAFEKLETKGDTDQS
jgi:hypothetical protein